MSTPVQTRETRIEIGETTGSVSAVCVVPAAADVAFVLAHGAGAGMRHRFMERIATELAQRRVATLRYQFPYMEAGRKRPDVPNRLVATVRAAVGAARTEFPGIPLIAGGKSLGGRMTSTAESREPLGVTGIVFLGFPLHAPNRPSSDRAGHLHDVGVPMLFLQGTRDALANLEFLTPVCEALDDRATLHIVDGGDHSFHVPKRSGRTEDDVFAELGDTIRAWWVGRKSGNRPVSG